MAHNTQYIHSLMYMIKSCFNILGLIIYIFHFQLEFDAYSGAGHTGDIALDMIEVKKGTCWKSKEFKLTLKDRNIRRCSYIYLNC